MQAVTYTRYGPPGVLQLRDVPTPSPRADEVLIRVRAVEATKSDCEMRSLRFAVRWVALPLRLVLGVTRPRQQVLGGYFSGEIAAVGSAVQGFSVGDAVYGAAGLRLGAYAEYLTMPAAGAIARKPRNMSFVEAAAVPFGGLNALHFMQRARLRAGESVLVIGAGGSIGAHAIQIAKAHGAEVTVVDAPHKRGLLRLGADHFVDFTRQHFGALGRRWDVVFSMVADTPYAACIGVLRPKGRFLSGNPRLSVMLRCVLTNLFTDRISTVAFAQETREGLQTLCEMVERGQIRSIVDADYPLNDAATAHERVEKELRVGAIVLCTDTDG